MNIVPIKQSFLDNMDALVRSLRTCASPRDCGECPYKKKFGESGCDRLEADAADAIQNLLGMIARGTPARPMNHADTIRAMSDEELAKLLRNPSPYEYTCPPSAASDEYRCNDNGCVACWLDWLKSSAEGGDGGHG